MSHEIPVPLITPSAQAARELAHRRWRPGNGDAAAASPGSNAARALALHRWRPAPPPQAAATTAPESPRSGVWSDLWGNVSIFLILGIVAFAIYSSRRKTGPQFKLGAGGGDDASRGDWTVWLAWGVVAGATFLLCSRVGRQNWGLIAGLGCVMVAALAPLG